MYQTQNHKVTGAEVRYKHRDNCVYSVQGLRVLSQSCLMGCSPRSATDWLGISDRLTNLALWALLLHVLSQKDNSFCLLRCRAPCKSGLKSYLLLIYTSRLSTELQLVSRE